MRGLRGIRLSIAAAALLLALLAILAVLQYRWIGEVTDAERARLRASAQASADAVALDLDREIGGVMREFGRPPRGEDASADPGARAAASARRWSSETKWPSLVSGVLLLGRSESGETVARIDLASGRTARIEWPVELESVRRLLEREGERPDGPSSPGPGSAGPPHPPFFHVFGQPPALLVPVGGRGPSPLAAGSRPDEQQWMLVLLDAPTIVGQMLPQLVQRHFGTGGEYYVAVLGGADFASVLYSSSAGLPPAKGRAPEAETPIFGAGPGGGGPRVPAPGDRAGAPRSDSAQGGQREGPPERGAWRLVAMHRSGSLDAMVDATRRKNLAVSAAILLLLGATVAFLVASAHAARQLAAQQIEFVAGLTHELRTPLAAIGSAGQNLADGVVAEPERVRKYGELIHREGRRLSGLIEGALAQAGIAAQAPQAPRGAVEIARLLEEAIETCRHLADREEATIEKDIAPGLPPVLGDTATLRTLFENLLANALKYGGRSGRVRVAARARDGAIQVSVADSGPGIPREEIGRIFEPFYRGRGAAGRAGGSGLGLSMVRRIVDSHGGSIAVESGGEGTIFRVTLPPAAETA